jgi:hypothetical protein
MRRKLLVLAVIALAVVAVGVTSATSVSAATSAETSAVSWALAQVGHTEYEGVPWVDRCLPFVQNAYADGTGPNIPVQSISSPTGGWNANTDPQEVWSGTFGAGTTGASSTTPPYGALVFFDAKSGYNPEDFSHVEIMGADGEMIGTPGTPGQAVFEETLAKHEAAHDYNAYVGWWLPDGATGSPAIGTQLAELKGSDSLLEDAFGNAVAISGGTAVVGGDGCADNAGCAYVFAKTTTGWKQTAELKKFAAYNSFGSSVATSGTVVVVGSPLADVFGRAYVFAEVGGRWKQVAELKGSGSFENFGVSVAISGTTIIVGSDLDARAAGRAYIFTETSGHWKQAAELEGDNTPYHGFGLAVAISGSTVVVTEPGFSKGAGGIYVFTNTGGRWRPTAELTGGPDTPAHDNLGLSVAISGTTIVVGGGAAKDPQDAGFVCVFTEAAGHWKEAAVLHGSDDVFKYGFGYSVGVSGTTIVVGAWTIASYVGRLYIFKKTATGWHNAADLGSLTDDIGGASVAISGTPAIVGSPYVPGLGGRAYLFEA